MDNFIEVHREGDVAVIRLSRSATNAISLEFVAALSEEINRLRQDASTCGIVLASANDKFFSIGFDIPELFGLAQESFAEFFHAFNRLCFDLYTLPKPVAAAITGHATAGGCILALCCDYRFIAQGYKLVGLNEVRLGVPVPYLVDCILRQIVGQRSGREIMELGAFYNPEAALGMGLVDQVLPLQEVVPEAVKRVKEIGAFPGSAFAAIKRNRTELVEQQVEQRWEERDKEFVASWYSAETRELLQQAMSKY